MNDIAVQRLINQQIARPSFDHPADLLHWMGAMQAQDYDMAKWALGVRLPGSTLKDIEAAIEQGDIIRTHLMRPTWHFVAADNLRWMLDLTAPRIKVYTRSRHKHLGLTEQLVSRSNQVIQTALKGGTYLTRTELVRILEEAGFENKDNRSSHLLLQAELDGIICSGPTKVKNYTYALMKERVAKSPKPDTNKMLARLAMIYFNSHGPATLEDFVWWSGLTKTAAQKALELVESDIDSATIDSRVYWFPVREPASSNHPSVHLLPAYDEYLVSYRNREAVISDSARKKAISNNGIFRPVIVADGEIIGIWKRTTKKDILVIETTFFEEPSKRIKNMVEQAGDKFAEFAGKKPEIYHNNL